ncbi:MAG: DUF4388 domain-containing protein, partial [Cystobacterineae bacterium]|nr:DUF4388 domain-containing protein [Cystobacterineae bacterium]
MKDLTALSLLPPPSGTWLPAPVGKIFSNIPASGQLSQVSALKLLGRLTVASAQGYLVLENEGGHLGFVFHHGKLIAAHSTWPQDSRERWLLAAGLLSPMELNAPGFHIERWLSSRLSSGKVASTQLMQCLLSVAQQTLGRALLWTHGNYIWQASLPKTQTPLSTNNWELFFSALRELDASFFQQYLGAYWEEPWKVGPNVANEESLPWNTEEYKALHQLKLCQTPAKAAGQNTAAPYARVAFILWQTELWVPQGETLALAPLYNTADTLLTTHPPHTAAGAPLITAVPITPPPSLSA